MENVQRRERADNAHGSWGAESKMMARYTRSVPDRRRCSTRRTDMGSPVAWRSLYVVVAAFAWTWVLPGEALCAEGATGNIAGQTGGGLELWVGGWDTHNVLRLDWQTGESLGFFVPSGAGGLSRAHSFSFGPDSNFYVASYGTSSVLRYDGQTGDFIDRFVGPGGNGLISAHTVFWNADGSLLVSSEGGNRVNRYDGTTGAFLDSFVSPGEAGLNGPEFIIKGPDGFLYLATQSNQILRLDPQVGGVVDVFVGDDPGTPQDETGGLSWAHGIAFGPHDGHLYVASSQNNRILRYDGTTGAFIDTFIESSGSFPLGIQFGPDGHLYVASFSNSRILKFDGQSGALIQLFANLGPMGLTGPLDIQFVTLPPPPVPAISGWAMIGLALCLITAGSITLRGSRGSNPASREVALNG